VLTSPEANPPAPVPRVAVGLGLYAAVVGLTSFVGWVADLRRLTDWYNSGISIQPNTTIAAMAAGAAVVSLALDKRRAAAALGLLAGVIGAMTVIQYVVNVDLGVDALLLFGRPWGRLGAVAPGRMGPPAATSFTLLGIGLLFAAGILRFRPLAPAFGLMVAGIATLSLMGYIFKASVLYTVPRLTTIAFQTSTVLFALGMGLVAALPEEQPIRLLRDPGAAGLLARRALPFIIVLPVVLGFLVEKGVIAGLYDPRMGTATLVAMLIFLLTGLLTWGAFVVNGRELEQRRAESALKEADRRKDVFLATLAHELRSPLAPIRNALHILRASGERIPAPASIDMVERQVGHLVRLVDDLMEVSRISRGQPQLRPERVALATIIAAAVETNRAKIDAASQRLSVSLPSEPLMLDADPVRLIQVFGNLLHNATKYTDRNGQLSITATRHGDRVTVSVRDSGIGISPALLPHVFEMFTQGDQARGRDTGGLGIGLALVQSLIHLHGGSVEARSEGLEKGSEFIVQLPLARGNGAEPPREAPAAVRTSHHRILVVDDNQDIADSLAELLGISGAETEVAYDGFVALERLNTFHPTVAMLDIGMPKMDGYELCGRIRGQDPTIVLIALTGWGQPEDVRRAKAAGFDHHLTKPIKPDTLLTLLASLERSAEATL
jgi:signal transduction histidine kinase/CheY-like chemotaxis protein